MPIKNFYTRVQVERTVSEIVDILVRHGASDILTSYSDSRQPIGLQFRIVADGGPLAFQMPVRYEAVFVILTREGYLKRNAAGRRAQARRVAWRNVKDWIDAQMALFEAEQVRMEEIFLPYMLYEGRTVYEALSQGEFRALPPA